MNGRRALISDSAGLVFVRVCGMGTGLLLTLLLARNLSPAEFGYTSTALSVALLGGLICSANYGASALRYLNQYRSENRVDRLHQYIYTGRKLAIGSALLLWSIAALLYSSLLPTPKLSDSLLLGLIAAPLLAMIRLEAANVHALGQVLRAVIPGTLVRPAMMLVAVSACLLLGLNLSASTVLTLLVASLVLIVIWQRALFYSVYSRFTPKQNTTPDRGMRRQWLSVSLQLAVPILFLEFSLDTIIVLASLSLPPEEVGALGIVLRVQSLILFGVTSINMAVSPRIAEAYNRGDESGVKQLLAMSAHLKLWPSLLVLLLLYFFGGDILALFGEHYRSQLELLLLASLTPLILTYYGPVVMFMTVLGLQRQGNAIFLRALLLLLLLIPVFSAYLSSYGTVLAVLVVWCFWNHALHRFIRQRTQIDTSLPAVTGRRLSLQQLNSRPSNAST